MSHRVKSCYSAFCFRYFCHSKLSFGWVVAVFVAFEPKFPEDVSDCGEKSLEYVCFAFWADGRVLVLLLLLFRDFLCLHTFCSHFVGFLEPFVFLGELSLVFSPVSREFTPNQVGPMDFPLVCLQLVV